jgi:hypothetical protein
MQIDLCPDCRTPLENVPEQLEVSGHPEGSKEAPAYVRGRARCPQCGYETAPFTMGEMTVARPPGLTYGPSKR